MHTTELLDSPLEIGRNVPIKEYNHIYLGVLNSYDIIISKLFRASQVDIEDCLLLIKAQINKIKWKELEKRFRETASFDVSEEKVIRNWVHFFKLIKREGLCGE